MVLEGIRDFWVNDDFLEKVLSDSPQPPAEREQWLRENYGTALEEAREAVRLLEGLDQEPPQLSEQERIDLKKEIGYSLDLNDFS